MNIQLITCTKLKKLAQCVEIISVGYFTSKTRNEIAEEQTSILFDNCMLIAAPRR